MIDILNSDDIVENKLINMYSTHNKFIKDYFSEMNEKEFLLWCIQYRHFNDIFAPCVISLASTIHIELNQLNHNVIGSEIAAGIYKACHHEYHENINGVEWTHSKLSKLFITTLAKIIDKDANINYIHSDTADAQNSVKRGYLVKKWDDFPQKKMSTYLPFGLGFHMASEFLAANEFLTIDKETKRNFPNIYRAMQQKIDGLAAWHWISIHSEVEVEHFKDALTSYKKSANLFPREVIAQGIDSFNELQKLFLESAALNIRKERS